MPLSKRSRENTARLFGSFRAALRPFVGAQRGQLCRCPRIACLLPCLLPCSKSRPRGHGLHNYATVVGVSSALDDLAPADEGPQGVALLAVGAHPAAIEATLVCSELPGLTSLVGTASLHALPRCFGVGSERAEAEALARHGVRLPPATTRLHLLFSPVPCLQSLALPRHRGGALTPFRRAVFLHSQADIATL